MQGTGGGRRRRRGGASDLTRGDARSKDVTRYGRAGEAV
jgi:hypothetical protein